MRLLPNTRSLLRNAVFCAVDLETTCLGRKAEPVEIGIVRFGKRMKENSYETLLHPRTPISKGSMLITGIKPSMLTKKPKPKAVRRQVKSLLKDSVLVFHNAGFDKPLIKKYFDVHRRYYLDSIELSRRLSPNARTHKLSSCCTRLGIAYSRRHRALADARAVSRIVLKFLAKFRRYKRLNDLRRDKLLHKMRD